MVTEKGLSEKTICDVVNYKEDIAPYPLVKIYSGVGSGKSYFATKMITGSEEYKIPEQNVLIITSRKSKVKETLKEMGILITDEITKNGNLSTEVYQTGETMPYAYDKYLKEIKVFYDEEEHTVLSYNKSVVCTNAFVAAYLRHVHRNDDPTTHIWNKFDAIIVDEVHSLVTDATYQSATFDVLALLQEYLRRYQNNQLQECACKHLILMTGTPEPFEALVKFDVPENLTNKLVLFDRCKNVVPKNVILIDAVTAQRKIQELLINKEKVIYFTNHILTPSSAKKKFNFHDEINIGVSFSNEDKMRTFSAEEQAKFDELHESLSAKSLIPNDIQFFVTTSRNKEGINVHNKDFRNMFVETHLMYDAVQMAGRVRSGVENFYIITDAEQFDCKGSFLDKTFSKKVMVANKDISNSADEANIFLKNEYFKEGRDDCSEELFEKISYYVKYIERIYPYVRYDVFERKFKFFSIKEDAEEMTDLQKNKFSQALLTDSNEYFKRWFSNSAIKREISAREEAKVYLEHLLGKSKWIRLSKTELKEHLSVIRDLFGSKLKSANPILHLVDEMYNCKESGDHYILFYGKEDPRTKKIPMKKRRKH